MNFLELAEELDLLNNYDENALRVYFENIGDLDGFEDAYIGCYGGWDLDDAIGDYIYEGHDPREIPDYLRNYVDWKAMGRDARLGGDIWGERVGVDEYVLFFNY